MNKQKLIVLTGPTAVGKSKLSIELAGKQTNDDIYRTADDLLRVARNIRKTADLVYKAEKSAIGIGY